MPHHGVGTKVDVMPPTSYDTGRHTIVAGVNQITINATPMKSVLLQAPSANVAGVVIVSPGANNPGVIIEPGQFLSVEFGRLEKLFFTGNTNDVLHWMLVHLE